MPIKRLFENSVFSWVVITTIIIVMIIINGVLAMKTIEDLSTTQSSLYNTGDVIIELDDLHNLVLMAETGQRGYLLTEIPEYLTPYEDAISRLSEQLIDTKKLHSEVPEQAKRIASLIRLVEQKVHELKITIELALANEEKSALKLVMTGTGRDLYKELRAELEHIKILEINHRNTLFAILSTVEREAKVTFAISGITSALLLLGLAFFARLNAKNEVRYRQQLEQQNDVLAEKVAMRTKELTLYSDELSRSNRELEDFAFVASHDLQEPLRKIRAFGDRLQSQYAQLLDEKGADYINRMKNAAERMSNLINDLLEFSRISTRGKPFTNVQLQPLIESTLDDLEISIEESDAKILLSDLPTINADPSQMHHLFINLISNAIKFRQVDIKPIIKINYYQEQAALEQWHIITVADNGIGFEQEFADKIFVPFQRLHARTEYKGTGIGLAICRRIVERHGGKISATSILGEGTQFRIEIPVENALINLIGENTHAQQ
ncbi:sensor histidine kinase [Cognaticolwellia beringensis]|uniref:histidine kinase n=1 Tax=Cognaticolwellia beringensis TaxID=1967665 RepID=A0A222G8U6_9GAMM|nr:sensor histidine kinase [Cognaticolwellia beringensis]ASP47774.1 histidine kinase [Cognaticolwellia beringensis]